MISFLFKEFLFNRVRNCKIDIQNFINKHFNNFVLVSFKIFLNFGNFLIRLFFKCCFKLFIFFLKIIKCITLSFIFSNSDYLLSRYLLTYCYAASRAYFNLRCLIYKITENEIKWTWFKFINASVITFLFEHFE